MLVLSGLGNHQLALKKHSNPMSSSKILGIYSKLRQITPELYTNISCVRKIQQFHKFSSERKKAVGVREEQSIVVGTWKILIMGTSSPSSSESGLQKTLPLSPLWSGMKKLYTSCLAVYKYVLEDQAQRFLMKSSFYAKLTEVLATKEVVYKYDLEDEVQRLLKEVKSAIEQVKESEFYTKLTEQIASDDFQDELEYVLRPHSKLKMVIYALGSLEFGYYPHHQLAIALLLKENCSWIEGIEVYDPLFSPADAIVLKELGCDVLQINERCRRKVERPTLFYMPCPGDLILVENLLEANWCPSRMNQLILLTAKLYTLVPEGHDAYRKAIEKYTTEFALHESYGVMFDYDFTWHFFDVDTELDMETLIAGKLSEISEKNRLKLQKEIEKLDQPYNFSKREREVEKKFLAPFAKDARNNEDLSKIYGLLRGPREYRCYSKPPPKGWIKLNIGGRGSDGNVPAGFGGICYNEFKEPILVYSGALGKVDDSTACIEALKRGLTDLLEKYEHQKLIVEGDNLKVIQWANNRNEPPEEVCGSLCEVFDLLMRFHSAVYHVYEEANLEAISLANKGAMS